MRKGNLINGLFHQGSQTARKNAGNSPDEHLNRWSGNQFIHYHTVYTHNLYTQFRYSLLRVVPEKQSGTNMSVVTPSALAANQQQSHSTINSPFAFGASFPEAYPDVVTPSALAATFINDEFTLYPSPFTSQVSSATFIKTLRLRAVDKLPFWLIEPLKLTAHIFNSIEFFQQLPANLASSSRTSIPNPPTSRPELVTLSSSDDIPNPPTTRPELVTLSSSSVVSLTNSPPARRQSAQLPATSSDDYIDVSVYD